MSRLTQALLQLHGLIHPDEAASILGVTTGTLAVWRSTGRYKLPFVKMGSRVRYRREDLAAFIEQCIHADGVTK